MVKHVKFLENQESGLNTYSLTAVQLGVQCYGQLLILLQVSDRGKDSGIILKQLSFLP